MPRGGLRTSGSAVVSAIAVIMKKTSAAFILLLLLSATAGAFIAAPFYTLYSLDKALDSSRPEALEKHVDFPRLQENMKRRLEEYVLVKWNQKMEREGIEQLAATQLLKVVIGRAVERYITPEGLIQLANSKGDDPLALVTDDILKQLSPRQERLYELGAKLRIPRELRLQGLSKLRELRDRFASKEEPAPPAAPGGQSEKSAPSQVSFNFNSTSDFAAAVPVGDSTELNLLLYRYNFLKWRLSDIILPLP